MKSKNLYVCLVMFSSEIGEEPLKVITAPIASDEEAAKQIAVAEARSQGPDYAAATPQEVTAYSFKRSKLEQAAREVLGWEPPT